MHVRLSSSIGLPVVDQDDEALGLLSGVLVDPDRGKVEGFFVQVPGFIGSHALFCSSLDIITWGTMIHVRDREVLSPAEDRVRLQSLLKDERTVLGQKVVTESGVCLGKCKDVQFDTEKMEITWLFPKRFFRWGTAIPVQEIIEVTKKSIIVKDPPHPKEEELDPAEALEVLKEITDPNIVRPG